MRSILSNVKGEFLLCPDILTEEEALSYLRLDIGGGKNPSGTLKYYRDKGFLHAVKIGRNLRYPKKELDRFIDRLLERRER